GKALAAINNIAIQTPAQRGGLPGVQLRRGFRLLLLPVVPLEAVFLADAFALPGERAACSRVIEARSVADGSGAWARLRSPERPPALRAPADSGATPLSLSARPTSSS